MKENHEKTEEDVQNVKREIGDIKRDIQRKIEEVENKVEGKIEKVQNKVEGRIEEIEEEDQDKINHLEKRLNDLEIRPNNFPAKPELQLSRPTVKPLTFDGQASWSVFKTQFDVVSFTNGWSDQAFVVVAQIAHGKNKCQKEKESFGPMPPPGAPVPQCDDDGNYRKVQCNDGGFCYCVNKKTGEQIGEGKRFGRGLNC
ncbi:unnamed protein product [Larinioides sclopetarius]|uniref:Thyroglobulin type-1 domain-containing protein n=1 Tax=Larinioides sclopetarius TaxID=280406 RepID=A0AAV2AN12_9ARAC